MTDTMLEAAAQLVGAVYVKSPYEDCFKIPYDTKNSSGWREWNPHHDDGDSARLRSALMMDVEWFDDGDSPFVDVSNTDGDMVRERMAKHNYDRNAALRMATLKCAAEVARRMG